MRGWLLGASMALLVVAPVHAGDRPNDRHVSYATERVFELINAERAAHGCRPLQRDARLEDAAERQSEYMARQHFFSHTDPDGTTPGKRVQQTGYVFQMVGENIEANTDTPEDAVTTWMHSPGHRANILTCAYKETGIAVVDQDDDVPVDGVPGVYNAYWTQVFAMPLRR